MLLKYLKINLNGEMISIHGSVIDTEKRFIHPFTFFTLYKQD